MEPELLVLVAEHTEHAQPGGAPDACQGLILVRHLHTAGAQMRQQDARKRRRAVGAGAVRREAGGTWDTPETGCPVLPTPPLAAPRGAQLALECVVGAPPASARPRVEARHSSGRRTGRPASCAGGGARARAELPEGAQSGADVWLQGRANLEMRTHSAIACE